ncbi:MAG: carbon-nitrogen hydrolase family protein, partial [Alphaproteobacteria bacterium]
MTAGRDPVAVAALQYCAAGTAEETLRTLMPLIDRAADDGAKLVCLPEAATFLAASRAALADEAEPAGESPVLDRLCNAAARRGIELSIGSMFFLGPDGRHVNRHLLVGADGGIRAQYDKIHMFDADVGDGKSYRESRYFAPGDEMVRADSCGMNMGLTICYDLRFPHLYRRLARDGAEMLAIPAAFTFNSGKAHWHVLLRARAIETGCFVVAAAQCGTHADGRRTYGHALIVSPWGEIMAEAAT